MHKKVVSSLAMLLVGFSTTAYADSYYQGNINLGPVYATSYTQAPGNIFDNTINTQGKGAELFIDNDGNHNKFGSVNLNFGRVKAKTKTVSLSEDVSNNEISTTAIGAVTGIKSEGYGNEFFNINGNKGPVTAITVTKAWTSSFDDIEGNKISTTAVGAVTGIESEGHGNKFFIINGNKGPVTAVTVTKAWDDVMDNEISTTAIGAQTDLKSTGDGNQSYVFNGNDRNHHQLERVNLNFGGVKAKTITASRRDNVTYNEISTTAIGALTGIKSEGKYNYFHIATGNKGYVVAETTTRAHEGVVNNEISTTAIGAYTGLVSDGSHNYFSTSNGNWGNVRATTVTEAWNDVIGNEISTTAIGAQTYLKSEGNGNIGHVFNINDGGVQAVTTTFAEDRVQANTIDTTAVGASLSIDSTKVGGQSFGRYYSSPNFFGSLNLNLGNVSAQTNTVGSSVIGNTINTRAVGAATSIRTGYSHR